MFSAILCNFADTHCYTERTFCTIRPSTTFGITDCIKLGRMDGRGLSVDMLILICIFSLVGTITCKGIGTREMYNSDSCKVVFRWAVHSTHVDGQFADRQHFMFCVCVHAYLKEYICACLCGNLC